MAVETDSVRSDMLAENMDEFLDSAADFAEQPVIVLNPFKCVFWPKRPMWLAQLGVLDQVSVQTRPETIDHDMLMHPCYGSIILPSLVQVSQLSIGTENQARTEILDRDLHIGLTNFGEDSMRQGWRPAKGRLGTFVVAGGKNIRDWLYTTATQRITYLEPWDNKDTQLDFGTGIRRTIETELDILESLM
jgi:hypothetical protein